MDEWVSLSRVAVQKGAQKDSPKKTVGFPEVSGDGPERKVTRTRRESMMRLIMFKRCEGGCVCICVRVWLEIGTLGPLFVVWNMAAMSDIPDRLGCWTLSASSP